MARIRRYRTAHLRGAQFLKVVRAERWISGGSFAYLSASHNGYARLLDPVIHRRSVFSSSGRFLVDPGAIEGTTSIKSRTPGMFAAGVNLTDLENGLLG